MEEVKFNRCPMYLPRPFYNGGVKLDIVIEIFRIKSQKRFNSSTETKLLKSYKLGHFSPVLLATFFVIQLKMLQTEAKLKLCSLRSLHQEIFFTQ